VALLLLAKKAAEEEAEVLALEKNRRNLPMKLNVIIELTEQLIL
jgi:hypothetical protein